MELQLLKAIQNMLILAAFLVYTDSVADPRVPETEITRPRQTETSRAETRRTRRPHRRSIRSQNYLQCVKSEIKEQSALKESKYVDWGPSTGESKPTGFDARIPTEFLLLRKADSNERMSSGNSFVNRFDVFTAGPYARLKNAYKTLNEHYFDDPMNSQEKARLRSRLIEVTQEVQIQEYKLPNDQKRQSELFDRVIEALDSQPDLSSLQNAFSLTSKEVEVFRATLGLKTNNLKTTDENQTLDFMIEKTADLTSKFELAKERILKSGILKSNQTIELLDFGGTAVVFSIPQTSEVIKVVFENRSFEEPSSRPFQARLNGNLILAKVFEFFAKRTSFKGKRLINVLPYTSSKAEIQKGIFKMKQVYGPSVYDLQIHFEILAKNASNGKSWKDPSLDKKTKRFIEQNRLYLSEDLLNNPNQMLELIGHVEQFYRDIDPYILSWRNSRTIPAEVRWRISNAVIPIGETQKIGSIEVGADFNSGRNVKWDGKGFWIYDF